MVAAGIIAMIGTAGMSDLGTISNAQIFFQGAVSFLIVCIGVWGSTNCTRTIEAEKRRVRRVKARSQKASAFSRAA